MDIENTMDERSLVNFNMFKYMLWLIPLSAPCPMFGSSRTSYANIDLPNVINKRINFPRKTSNFKDGVDADLIDKEI